jgi:hypothetical protein
MSASVSVYFILYKTHSKQTTAGQYPPTHPWPSVCHHWELEAAKFSTPPLIQGYLISPNISLL